MLVSEGSGRLGGHQVLPCCVVYHEAWNGVYEVNLPIVEIFRNARIAFNGNLQVK